MKTVRDVGLSAYNGVRAFLAVELKRHPSDPEILNVMTEASKSAGFSARVVRLIEAARRSPSERRRQMLASVLYGLPFTDTDEADRERVDMLVERLMPQDVDLLNKIASLWKSLSVHDPNPCCLALHWSGMRLFRYPLPGSAYLSRELVERAPVESAVAFSALQSAGCIEDVTGSGFDDLVVEGIGVESDVLRVSRLGALLLRALGDVCPDVGGREPAR